MFSATLLASPSAAFTLSSLSHVRSGHHLRQAARMTHTPRSHPRLCMQQQQDLEPADVRLRAELDDLYPTQRRAPLGDKSEQSEELAEAEAAARAAVAASIAKAKPLKTLSKEAAALAKAEEEARAAVAASIANGARRAPEGSATLPEPVTERNLELTETRDAQEENLAKSEDAGTEQGGEVALQEIDTPLQAIQEQEHVAEGIEKAVALADDAGANGKDVQVERLSTRAPSAGDASSSQWSQTDSDVLFEEADVDRSGSLEYAEFAAMTCNQGLDSDVLLATFERCVAEWCACWLVPRVRMRVKRLLRLGFHGFHSTCR